MGAKKNFLPIVPIEIDATHVCQNARTSINSMKKSVSKSKKTKSSKSIKQVDYPRIEQLGIKIYPGPYTLSIDNGLV